MRGIGPFRGEVSLDLAGIEGPLVALVGSNGAGKSSVCEAFAGALYRDTPTRGTLASLATGRDSYIEARVANGRDWTIRHSLDASSRKGESFVFDDAGAPALADSKVSSFDAWSKSHLLDPSVFYASVFHAQSGESFIGAGGGGRKAILLRMLQIDRLERLSAKARERARAAKEAVSVLRARIEDAKASGVDRPTAEAALSAAKVDAGVADALVVSLRAELAAVQAEADRVRGLVAAEQERQRRMGELRGKLDAARARVADLEGRVANNRGVLSRAEEVYVAAERAAVIDCRLSAGAAEMAKLEAAVHASERETKTHQQMAGAAQHRGGMASERVRLAEGRMAQRDAVAKAVAALEGLRAELAAAEAVVTSSTTRVEELQARRIGSAEDRIVGLRGALSSVADALQTCEDAREGIEEAECLAQRALEHDDRTVSLASEAPAELLKAVEALTAAHGRVQTARKALESTERLAHMAGAIDAAQGERDAAMRDLAAARTEHMESTGLASVALQQACASRGAMDAIRAELQPLSAERAGMAPILALGDRLATAEARLAELEPQLAEATADVGATWAALRDLDCSVPSGTQPPPMPDVERVRGCLSEAEKSLARKQAAVDVASRELCAAVLREERLGGLSLEMSAASEELGDWTRLGDDLGKDGLVAMEIDCVGPELTALTNDLLHTCVGPRWTVSIETQRVSADGKKMIEDCDVRVIDSESGRDALIETYSGGERVIIGEAVALALTMLVCRRSGIERPTLVRDESGAALDPSNASAYVAMLRRAANLIGADRVLFVSHSKEVQDLADARVRVHAGNIEVIQ